MEGSVIGGIEWLVNEDGVLDLVDLLLDLDNGSIDSLCSPEDGGDSDGKVRSGGLQDPGGISGDIAGLPKVDLLGDDWGGLVDGGDALGLGVGGEGSRGGGLGIVDGVRHDGPGTVVLRSIGWNCGRVSAYQLCGGTVGTPQEESKGHLKPSNVTQGGVAGVGLESSDNKTCLLMSGISLFYLQKVSYCQMSSTELLKIDCNISPPSDNIYSWAAVVSGEM